MKLLWQNKDTAQRRLRDKRMCSFLFHEGSLTRLIQQHCPGEFQVELITESWSRPIADEPRLLSLRKQEQTFIREAWLTCDKQRLVYARTIIPRKTLEGKCRSLTRLGTKPLGDVLFKDNTSFRSQMRYARIPLQSELYKKIIRGSAKTNPVLWGRQSLFHIRNKPLLVIEVFLPAIIECKKN